MRTKKATPTINVPTPEQNFKAAVRQYHSLLTDHRAKVGEVLLEIAQYEKQEHCGYSDIVFAAQRLIRHKTIVTRLERVEHVEDYATNRKAFFQAITDLKDEIIRDLSESEIWRSNCTCPWVNAEKQQKARAITELLRGLEYLLRLE